MRTTTTESRGLRTARRAALAALLFTIAGTTGVAAQMTPPPDFLVTVPSSYEFDETVALLKQAIAGQNLMVVDEINPQQMLRLVGMRSAGMRQILFFHPRYMKAIIEANANGGIEAPLKVLVMERPDGKTVVRYHDLEHLFAPYDGLEDVVSEMQGAMEQIVASVR
jgi:uncharacterized protein (DUF302 family)